MTGEVAERPAKDGYEFLSDGEVVGGLVWVASASEAHSAAGWWLVRVAGKPDEAMYRVPKSLADDLECIAGRAFDDFRLGA